ncbi:MAG: N-acetylmuramoyl-L-alanine amidase [Flavobacterium sp.]|nr:MAG: N-acetylmuramoyl-L-alanine amidase [Flavobacterium sp.]
MGNSKIKFPLFPIIFCVFSLTAFSQNAKFKVALDAGHGAHDPGSSYNGHIEKNIALAVVLKVGKILEDTPGFQVIYTRKTDVFVDLVERANIANRADAHIFVSIHCNANKNSAAAGTETYVMGMNKIASNLEAAKRENSVITLEKDYKQKYEGYNPNRPETMLGTTMQQELYLANSIALADKIEDIFTDELKKKSRGVKQAPYMVLHKAYMPRVLVEMGFISNRDDGAFLDSDYGQTQISKAIADAIIGYKNEYFGNGDVESVAERPITKVIPDSPASVSKLPERAISADPNGVTFKVQLAVSSRKIALIPTNFNGLANISMVKTNNLYKYAYGETNDYNDARKLLLEAQAKGYESAFVVAFRDGENINIKEALND